MKDYLTDDNNEDFKSYVDNWPPTDAAGNVYPIWFTVDELNERGELIDSRDNNYNPFAGNLVPCNEEWERCNTPLTNWRERYPNIRFCGQVIENYQGNPDFCFIHNGRDNVKTAEEALQTGLHTKTLDHLYEKVGPWKKLIGWGTYESLMGQSSYDFGMEYKEQSFDFSAEPIQPDGTDDNGILSVRCGYPTQHLDQSLSLFAASMMGVQMVTVQPRIMEEDPEKGEGMMESKTIETAQLTAPPSEHDPSPQEFKTLETWSEHHLNLPLSRLVSDREKLLEMGGVSTDPEANDDEVSDGEIVMEVEAEADAFETTEEPSDPNSFGGEQAVSQEIAENIED